MSNFAQTIVNGVGFQGQAMSFRERNDNDDATPGAKPKGTEAGAGTRATNVQQVFDNGPRQGAFCRPGPGDGFNGEEPGDWADAVAKARAVLQRWASRVAGERGSFAAVDSDAQTVKIEKNVQGPVCISIGNDYELWYDGARPSLKVKVFNVDGAVDVVKGY